MIKCDQIPSTYFNIHSLYLLYHFLLTKAQDHACMHEGVVEMYRCVCALQLADSWFALRTVEAYRNLLEAEPFFTKTHFILVR